MAQGSALKLALDELNYSLSVEWDQKDPAFQAQQIKKFRAKILELKKNGATAEQLLSEAQGMIADRSLRDQVTSAAALLNPHKLSDDQLLNAILDTRTQAEIRGASWSGEFFQENLPYIVVAIVILMLVISSQGSDSSSGGTSAESDSCGYKGDGSFQCGTDCGYRANGAYLCGSDCGYKGDGSFQCGTNCGYKANGAYLCGTNCGYKANGEYLCVPN